MKAGLEVHQQLATNKLFCACPSELSESVTAVVRRRLRATGGESHQIDPAAAFQAARGLTYAYEAVTTSCLVDLDEEPPHPLNEDALNVALTMALLLHARPLDEVEVMRKIVVDGSNTAGFQRTALVAVDGFVEVAGRRYSTPTICLEEDAARKVGEEQDELGYRLDRLGIPLIEIATGPEIRSGAEAREVAEELGALLRATGKVRRGIGSIREDLNVSTEGGARVEIKGVQELRLLHRYAEIEEERQKVLLGVQGTLRDRKVLPPEGLPMDVSDALRPVASGPMGEALARDGRVIALGLPGFSGLLRSPPGSGERLGRELADSARAAGLRGLFHSDEVPAQGVDASCASTLRARLGLGPEDAFVLFAERPVGSAERAVAAVRRRARQAIEGIPSETRDPLPDGRSRYSRPLPGRDRMYPETDVPPIPVTAERLDRLRASLPQRPELVRARIVRETGLGGELVRQMQRSGDLELFETLVGQGHSAGSVSRLLTQDLPAVREQVPSGSERFSGSLLDSVLTELDRGAFSKEGLPPVLLALSRGAVSVEEAIQRAGLAQMSTTELREAANRLVSENRAMIDERGPAAFSPLMGDLMRAVRGRRDGKEVAEALRAALSDRPAPTGGA
ncbi:MAG: Glu-tRNA(Gln) amidotransferase subunit GatE [Thermoplasmata archaeon]|nr:Glu-tRNA(Gln) amidotransferase subunit GatE [Thermoplasmata archaeon]